MNNPPLCRFGREDTAELMVNACVYRAAFKKEFLRTVLQSGCESLHNCCMSSNNFLDLVRNFKHRKQSAIPPLRMPALLGMLVCAAGLLAIPRKAFSQGQGMNRPIGIMYLRPLVGSVSAIVAAILLYASNHADAQSQAPPMIGIMYLEDADALGDPVHHWSRDPAVTNPYVQGIALRTHWNRVEPHEHARRK